MPLSAEDLGRQLIDYDPGAPEARFFATATEMAAALAQGGLADPVPWPAGLAPALATPPEPPPSSQPLPKADVLVVTWTSAEARTMSVLLTPGAPLEQWYEYKSNVAAFIPKVTGHKAPFNAANMPRYFHSLGLYCPITLAGKRVLCFKSGLHMDYDGPALPLVDLWKQIIAETGCELIITTGTGGGIGANVLLGDVIVAAHTVFDCTTQFKAQPFGHASYPTSALPDGWTPPPPALLKPNADHVLKSGLPSHPDGLPAFFYAGSQIADPKIVTTDFFAFDNTTDTNHLQELGNVCDMGDASLGLALSQIDNPPKWAAIRNASDPQIDGSLPPTQQNQTAGSIYQHFGGFTTAASVLGAWSFVCKAYAPAAAPAAALAMMAPTPATSQSLVRTQQRQTQTDPTHIILQIAASSGLKTADVQEADAPAATLAAVKAYLPTINVSAATSTLSYRRLSYLDETHRRQELYLIQVSNDDAESFRGTYLYSLGDLVAKEEFVSD
jgi:hypothetical protein